MVFRSSVILLGLLVLAAILAPERVGKYTRQAQLASLAGGGRLYLLIVFSILVFLIVLAFSRMGQLRIGGDDADPEFSSISWFAMLFSAGMGIGLVFWGVAEPLSHFAKPPELIAAQSVDAARASMRYTFFHWGLHPWAIYALMGLAMAWFQFNRHSRGLVSDLLQPLLGSRITTGVGGSIVDVLAVVVTAIGVATTLGFGASQIGAGLHQVYGVPDGFATQLIVIAVAFVLYMLSSATGLKRGIKWLSNFNMGMAALLLALVIVLGPTAFIFDTLTTTLGSYINQLPAMSLRMSPLSQNSWVGNWTIFYWGGYQFVLFSIFEHLPLSTLLSTCAIVLLMSFFVTSADSATLVLASMSSEDGEEPPLRRRMVWGVLQAGIAVALLASGGLDALQATVIVAALPFALLMVVVAVSLLKVLREESRRKDRETRELHRAELRWLAAERERLQTMLDSVDDRPSEQAAAAKPGSGSD